MHTLSGTRPIRSCGAFEIGTERVLGSSLDFVLTGNVY